MIRIEDALSRIAPQQEKSKLQVRPEIRGKSFDEVLNGLSQKSEITFSKHAGQRIAEREIEVTDRDLERLGEAVKRAGEKGVRNTLVLMDRNAFIVNVPSGTVITAMGEKDISQNVFTQIDGAVIL